MSWLMEIGDQSGADRVLYALPHAGAGIAATRPLLREVAPAWAAVGVRLPGRESLVAEEPIDRIDVLADELCRQIELHAQQREIAVLGHCSGALLGFEVVRRLADQSVSVFFASAHPSPGRSHVQASSHLPQDDFLAQVAADGYLPRSIAADRDLLELVEPALRADYAWTESFTDSGTVVACDIVTILGLDDNSMTRDDVENWSESTTGKYVAALVPGGHDLLSDPAGLADVIRNYRSDRGSPRSA